MEITLTKLQDFQRSFDDAHEGRVPFLDERSTDRVQALEHLIVCLAGELGEFANIVKKIRRGDFEYGQTADDLNKELADIFAYVLKTANLMQVDLADAYLSKMEENRVKFQRYES